jgi:hypothetical protein
MGTYTDFSEKGVTYSDLYTDFADIRSSATISSHVWLPSGKTTGFKVEGINTTGATNLKLSYNAKLAAAPIAAIKVKVNG